MKLWITRLSNGCVITPDDNKSLAYHSSIEGGSARLADLYDSLESGDAISVYTHEAKKQ